MHCAFIRSPKKIVINFNKSFLQDKETLWGKHSLRRKSVPQKQEKLKK
jgi:hypothetical protein